MKHPVLICLFLILLNLAVFAQVVYHDFFVIDDLSYIRNNPHIQSGINVASIRWAFTADLTHDSPGTDYWQPITHLSRMLDMQIFGPNPGGHHAINLLIHIFNTLLLFGLLLTVTTEIWPSALVAALFAIHPFQVETVAWATARKDLLAGFFGLLSMQAYVCYVRKRDSRTLFLSIILFALSLMSKPMLVTMPFVFLLLDFWPLGRAPVGRRLFERRSAAWSSGAVRSARHLEQQYRAASAVPLKRVGSFGSAESRRENRALMFEKSPYLILSLLVVLIVKNAPSISFYAIPPQLIFRTIPSAYVWYLDHAFFPRNLCLRSPDFSSLTPLWQVSGLILILAVISFLVLRQNVKRPYLAFGWFWFLTTLAPATSLIPVGDRFMYFPIIGLAVMSAWGGRDLLNTLHTPQVGQFGAAMVFVTLLAFASSTQTVKWRNSFTFLNHMIASQKNNFLAEYNLGVFYARNGYFEDAIEHYQNTLAITPDKAFVYDNIGLAYFKMGRLEEARKAFQTAVTLDPAFEGARLHLKELEK